MRWRLLLKLLTAVVMLSCACQVFAADGKRVALVMGNDAYQNVRKLEKAGNDATAMARELKAAGFEVTLARDLDYRAMLKKVDFFTSHLTGGDQVVVFFAGHGVQLRSGSYLLPTDIEANSESEVEKTAISLNDVMDKLSEAKASFAMVMLDACRDNPLKSNGRALGANRGLLPPDPPKGQMVVYSASKGQQALDKMGEKDNNPNGVFTREFIARMRKPGVRIEDLVRQVQDSVEDLAKSIGHEQRPALYNEARGNFYFFGPTTVQVNPPGGTAPIYVALAKTAEQIEDDTWDSVKDSADVASLEEYLRQYPKGRHVGQARVAIAKVKADAKRASAAVTPVVLAAQVTTPVTGASGDAETALWQAVVTGNTADDYAAYVQQYNRGKYLSLARQRIQKLEEEAKAKVQAEETAAWQAAETAQSVEAYQAYAKRYPSGNYSALAQSRIKKVKVEQTRQEEARAWQTVQKGGVKEVSAYLDRYSTGTYAGEAIALLEKLKREEAEMRPGKVFKDCPDCPDMVIVPAGSFMIGGEGINEKPVHSVTIKSFAVGRIAVTKGQFAAFVQAKSYVTEAEQGDGCYAWTGSIHKTDRLYNWRNVGFSQSDDHPVVCVSWNDAKAYTQWITQATGKPYRLLSESEREYAVRAGTTSKYWWGDTASRDYANYGTDQCCGAFEAKVTVPGGKYPANRFGLYDMSGNSFDWVEDEFHENYNGAPTDGSAWVSGGDKKLRVIRGSSWESSLTGLRSSYRAYGAPDSRDGDGGFRLARTLVTP